MAVSTVMVEQSVKHRRDIVTLFAAGRDDPRRRRLSDVWLLSVAAVLSLIAGLIAAGDVVDEERITQAFESLLGWLEPLWTIIYNGATVLIVALLLLAAIRRRWALVRDVVVAAALPVAIGYALAVWVSGSAPSLAHVFWGSGAPQYPELRVAAFTAVSLVASPDLTRPFRRLGHFAIGAVALSTLVLGGTYPSYLLGGLALGIGAGAIARLLFGSTAGFPTDGRVRFGLAELGIEVDQLTLDDDAPTGAVLYVGEATSGPRLGPIAVTVYGRDARDTQLLSRLWRSLWYTDAGPHASVTRRELVEHEALMLFAAADAGVTVPHPLTAGTVSRSDALLVTSEPAWDRLSELAHDDVTDEIVDQMWALAAQMRRSRIAHGALNVEAFRVIDARVGVVGWSRGGLSAHDDALASDTAELLVSCTMLVGEERALRAAEKGLGRDTLALALPYLQRAALTPALRDAAKEADVDIESLRKTLATTVGEDLPQIAALRRVSIRDVVLMALVGLAAYAVISQIADVGLATIINELRDAEWSWVLFGLLIVQLTLVFQAYSTIAAVGRALPFGPTVLLQSSVKFIGISVPSAAGRVALTTRFLTKQGVAAAVALTQGAIDSVAGFIVQLMILLTILPFLDLNLNFDDVDVGPMIKAGVIVLVGGVVVAIVFLIVPSLRRRVQPFISAAWTNIKSLASSPKRLVQIVGANFGDQLCYAVAMGASVRAVGAEASIAELLVINTLTSLLSGLVPVPGGIGVAEFVIASGLTAVGVPPAQAFAATIIYRILSCYIPPVPGYVSLKWLSNHGYV